jgi:hypothetical protein
MTFKVLDVTTLKIINQSIICQASDQCNLHIDPDFSPTQTPAPFLLSDAGPVPAPPSALLSSPRDQDLLEGRLLQTIPAIDLDSLYNEVKTSLRTGEPQNGEQPNGEHDPNGELPTTKGELDIGQTVLMPVQSDGQQFCAKILQQVDKHKNSLAKECLTNAKYRVLVGHDKSNMWEEVVAYNDLVNFIEGTEAVKEGEWKFKEIIHHNGPLTKTSPNYKGSTD